MQVEIRYTEYKDVGSGAKFPFHIHMHQGDHPFLGGRNLMDLAISNAVVNVANAAQAVPDAVRTAKPPVVNVTTMQLAPGVWLLAGGSHNSVAVEFRDYITVIEGPLDDDRSNAVIAAAKRVIPNKPIRYLVNTHHHWDHSGGIRAFAAEGATIVTQESNKDFYERIVLAPQPRSLNPDRLAKFPFATTGPGPQKLETFAERHAISDGTQTVISYHVEGLNHAGDMAIVYLPGPKLLVSADMGPPAPNTPAANVNANSVALYNNIKRLKLDVTQHVPIHGNPSSHADFERTVAPAAAQQPQTAAGAWSLATSEETAVDPGAPLWRLPPIPFSTCMHQVLSIRGRCFGQSVPPSSLCCERCRLQIGNVRRLRVRGLSATSSRIFSTPHFEGCRSIGMAWIHRRPIARSRLNATSCASSIV